MIRCLLVDDEKFALELMEDNVQKVPFLRQVGRCRNAVEAMEVLSREHVDLIFLDVQMPGLSGLQFLNSLANPPMVIIVSAYNQYAMDGFNLDVVDYLLKPVAFERFLKAVNKANKQIGSGRQDGVQVTKISIEPEYLFVNADYSVVRIDIPQILYVEGLKDYIKIYSENTSKPVITRLSMRFMEEKLPVEGFARVHKSFIVALNKVTAVKKNRVMIKETEIPLSDNFKDKILSYIGQQEHDNN